MFEPHYQPDGASRAWASASSAPKPPATALVLHDGILPGFNSELLVAPDDGIGADRLHERLEWGLRVAADRARAVAARPARPAEDAVRSDIPHHPEVWPELCGRYVFPPRIADLRQRLMLGLGAEVFVRGGRLMVRLLTPVPALLRGLPLQPDDARDPYVFRLDLSQVRGWRRFESPSVVMPEAGSRRLTPIWVVSRGRSIRAPDGANRRAWLRPAAGAVAAACVVTVVRRRSRRREAT